MSSTKPFVKWAGGKRQIINQLLQNSPMKFGEYFEPFVGGGALFFKLSEIGKIKSAHLNDRNKVLVDAYKVIKENPQELIDELKKNKYKNEKSVFYIIRKEEPTDIIEATARFIYLNRTAFNGLYRVNSKGKFNVPFGRYKNPKLLDEDNILAVSKALLKTEITNVNFEEAVSSAKKGDFIYFDPPYNPLSKTSCFTSYTKDDFNEKDQKRLANTFRELHNRGCFVMLSNSYSPLVLELYEEFRGNIHPVFAFRMINCKAEGRGRIRESIITNYNNYSRL